MPTSSPQVAEDTSAAAQANWAALWAAIGRSDTALVFHMSDHYSLVHAARQYTLDLGMPKMSCLLASHDTMWVSRRTCGTRSGLSLAGTC